MEAEVSGGGSLTGYEVKINSENYSIFFHPDDRKNGGDIS